MTRLPAVVAALNHEVTRLTGKKPVDAIRAKVIISKPSAPPRKGRLVGMAEKPLPNDSLVRFLYQPREIEGVQRRRATDAIWSLQVYRLGHSITKPQEPILYYLQDGPKRGFVREELLVVPPDTELPPSSSIL